MKKATLQPREVFPFRTINFFSDLLLYSQRFVSGEKVSLNYSRWTVSWKQELRDHRSQQWAGFKYIKFDIVKCIVVYSKLVISNWFLFLKIKKNKTKV